MNRSDHRISVVILSKNDEARITPCLASVMWADEVVVIDNGSTDTTVQIAKNSGVRVIESAVSDFSLLRNLGRDTAKFPWLLYVDSDEIVPAALQHEIREVISRFHPDSSPYAYIIKRKNYYLGYPWPYQDEMRRLFWKQSLQGWIGELHESAIIKGPVATLVTPLLHLTHRTLEEMVAKTNRWSRTEAMLRFRANHPPVVWWRLLRVMCTGFIDSYIRQRGWKAGTAGLIESMYQAFSMFITYAKLWELQQQHRT